jgi:alpha-galactosidase
MKHELPGELTGDHRDGAVTIRTQGGHTAVQPYYVSHRIFQGKERLEGLPATFGHEEDTMSLEITMEDPVLHVRFLLTYSVFADTDAVMRSMRVINDGTESVRLEKALSLSLDMDCTDRNQKPYRLLTLDGMWVRERHMNFRDIGYGFQGVCSNRGETSHHEQAFLGLVSPSATWHDGEVYGFHLIYSGNFRGQVERDAYEALRVTLGINPDRFAFTLQPGQSFQAPEGVMVFSA